MMYRLGFPLLIVAVLATLGIASAMGHNVLPDTVLDFLNGSAPSSRGSEVANLAKAQPARQEERRSSAGWNGGAALPADLFQDFFDMGDGFPADISASLASQGSTGDVPRNYGFASSSRNSGNSSQGYSVLSGSTHNQGGNAPSSGGVASWGGSGGSGGGSGGTTGTPLDQSLVLASLVKGLDEGGGGGSKNSPATDDDSGVLPQSTKSPQTTEIPQAEFVPVVDPLMGAPFQDVLPEPMEEANADPAPVPNPEPGTLILGGLGLAIMAVAHRRMRSRQGE